jgi:hypothetical protein
VMVVQLGEILLCAIRRIVVLGGGGGGTGW